METIKLNIALRFEDNILQEIADTMSEFKGNFEAKYIVDNETAIPHITLYQNIFPKNKVKDIEQLLSDISGNTTSFSLKFRKLLNFKSSIWAEFGRPAELLNLHQNVIEQIQPMRDGLVEPQFESDHPVFQSLTVTRKKMIEKYGHPHVGEMFDSHISLAKLIDRELVYVVLNRIDWRITELPINKIALYEGGEEGTCKELIQEFKLQD